MFQKVFGPAILKRGRQVPSYEEVRYNASLVLGNGNIVTSDPFPIPNNYKDIGGYHIFNYNKSLPQNLQDILDNSRNGVIYFSLGSILKVSSMSNNLQKAILEVLSNTNREVIFNSDVTFSNVAQNINIVNYAPQLNILAHPNCVLFVTHSGLLSLTEALYYGVPVIGVPFFADQYNNINKVADLGYGKQAYLDVESAGNLQEVMAESLDNPKYRQRAKKLSKIYHHKLVNPGKKLVHWIEHVILSGGAPHLRSHSLKK
ncbi:UDP-glycosyltransferase UGT5-like [Aricia agestis]|uniref:UDP-glycosyltransferase UGT5-like n=1 Tax=Aricia agestis TaxID=91739 RepID=UPI001C206BF0|nr:UDP-glycosyltransferase UGT5-like [Aricia agestis]